MRSAAEPETILVVEGDAVLGQVLSRVLARDGLKILHATNTAQALQLADAAGEAEQPEHLPAGPPPVRPIVQLPRAS